MPDGGLSGDRIEIADPDPDWPRAFAAERQRIEAALDGVAWLAIEHNGSTAVPGLPAKPVIDILLAVPSLSAARETFPGRLAKLDYVFWSDNPKMDRLYFVKGMPPYGAKRTHHLHVCQRPSAMWSQLKFRDYLRDHPDEAARYAALKRDLAARYADDREAYTDGKAAFIAEILARLEGGD